MSAIAPHPHALDGSVGICYSGASRHGNSSFMRPGLLHAVPCCDSAQLPLPVRRSGGVRSCMSIRASPAPWVGHLSSRLYDSAVRRMRLHRCLSSSAVCLGSHSRLGSPLSRPVNSTTRNRMRSSHRRAMPACWRWAWKHCPDVAGHCLEYGPPVKGCGNTVGAEKTDLHNGIVMVR